jgi:hypothetical protein
MNQSLNRCCYEDLNPCLQVNNNSVLDHFYSLSVHDV